MDCFIYSPAPDGDDAENVDMLQQNGIPFVITERALRIDTAYPFVVSDNSEAGQIMGNHLVSEE